MGKEKLNKAIKDLLPFEEKNLILLGLRGSLAHGTYIQDYTDDRDVFGIVIPPIDYFYGLKKYEGTERFEGDIDLLIFDIRKYITLLLKNNPNVLSLLWLQDNQYLKRTELGKRLIANRYMFLSKKCYNTYSGYAYGQLKRMTHYNKQGYMGKKRKELVEKYGYDCKNASHLIRLLKMGIEILTTGEVNVLRKDSQLYISIKKGEWSLEKVKSEADRLFALIDEAYVRSDLPNEPDYKWANKFCIESIKDFFNE